MAAAIGTLSFTLMSGSPAVPAEALERFDRIGRDHSSYRRVGLRAAESEILTLTIIASTAAAAAARRDAELALQGTTVTITDSHGLEYTHCTIAGVAPRIRQALYQGAEVHLVRTRWVVQAGEQDG